ncbi:MAG: sulfate adenylyltransferase, partial [Actinobacteria bacterium HGW-Actinobacteria-8]
PARLRERVLVQHGTGLVQGMITGISGVLDITLPGGTLESSIVPGDSLALNDIGVVTVLLARPLPVEDYGAHRRTGAFVLVDPHDGATLAAGTARAAAPGTGPDGYLSI